MVAGATGFPRRRFVALSTLAGTSWSAYMVGVGILAGTWAANNPMFSIALAIIIAIAAGVLIDRTLARLEARRERQQDGDVGADAPLEVVRP